MIGRWHMAGCGDPDGEHVICPPSAIGLSESGARALLAQSVDGLAMRARGYRKRAVRYAGQGSFALAADMTACAEREEAAAARKREHLAALEGLARPLAA